MTGLCCEVCGSDRVRLLRDKYLCLACGYVPS